MIRSCAARGFRRRAGVRPERRPAGWLRRLCFILLPFAGACATLPPAAPWPAEAAAAPAPDTTTTLRRVAGEEESGLLARLAAADGDRPARLVPGNAVELLVDGPQTHAAMLQAIAAAHRHIRLETYILEASTQFAQLLAAKRTQGVQVSVLYDSVGSLSTPAEYFRGLADAGIALCEFNPVNPLKADKGWQINKRDHRKLLVVDSLVAFTGGINISKVYSSGSFGRKARAPTREEGWRDTHVQVRGPVAADFERLFLDNWEGQHCPPLAAPAAPAGRSGAAARQGDQAVRLVAANPELGQSELYVALLLAIANAKSRIWLTYGYFVPDGRMLAALQAAARRGVDVRLVLPGFSDFWAPFHAGRSHYAALLDAGVRIFERRDALLHAKTAVVDTVWASVGSTNLDWRSFVSNYEADLIVFDRGFARRLEQLFELDQGASQEIRLADWQRRGLGDRFKEWLARRWERLL